MHIRQRAEKLEGLFDRIISCMSSSSWRGRARRARRESGKSHACAARCVEARGSQLKTAERALSCQARRGRVRCAQTPFSVSILRPPSLRRRDGWCEQSRQCRRPELRGAERGHDEIRAAASAASTGIAQHDAARVDRACGELGADAEQASPVVPSRSAGHALGVEAGPMVGPPRRVATR
jgi:hypothetical protein